MVLPHGVLDTVNNASVVARQLDNAAHGCVSGTVTKSGANHLKLARLQN